MRRTVLTILLILISGLWFSCGHRQMQSVAPNGSDTEPPEWNSYEGIRNAVPGDSSVKVYWDLASESATPPVIYLIFMDTDEYPWDQIPV